MQNYTAEAIVLDVLDLHDFDRIVVFLTQWKGKKRGVAQGSRRKFSRFAGQLQPLAKAKVSWHEKESSELVRISSVEMIRSAEPMQTDLEGLLLSSYLRDHLIEFAQENEPDDRLSRLLDSTVTALLEGVDRNLATRYFEAWVLRLSGIFPAPWRCPECDGLLSEKGAVLPTQADGLVCRDCGDGQAWRVSPEVLEFLLRVGRQDLLSLGGSAPAGSILKQVDELCAQIRRRFLQKELKSYQVIRDTLEGLDTTAKVELIHED